MIMCVLLCYPVSIHMSQLLSTGRPISSISFITVYLFQICTHVFPIHRALVHVRKRHM